MLRAIADLMGGYFYSYLGPIVKLSFYAGKVRYRNVEKIFLLLEQIKSFLRTDGVGWKRPIELEMFINVTPIALVDQDGPDSCEKLIIRYSSENLSSKILEIIYLFVIVILQFLQQ